MQTYLQLLEEAADAARAMLKEAPGTAKHYQALQRLKAALSALDEHKHQEDGGSGTAEY